MAFNKEQIYWHDVILSTANSFGLILQYGGDNHYFVGDGIRVEVKDCNTEQEQSLLSIAIAQNSKRKLREYMLNHK